MQNQSPSSTLSFKSAGGQRRAPGIVFLLSLLLFAKLLAPPAARGQIEIAAQERAEMVAALEVEEVALGRRLIASQELAFWLPEGWEELPRFVERHERYSPDGGETVLHLERQPTQPGASLIQIMEHTVEQLQNADLMAEAATVRRLRVASRDALEITAPCQVQGAEGSARLLVAMDPSRSHFRLVLLQAKASSGEDPDVTFKRFLRDWSPLDETAWSLSLERARRPLVDDAPALPWAERNRLFDAVARPAAIGQTWVRKRLGDLAGRDPLLLLDGLLHHHPRVRIASLEALEPAFLEEAARTTFYSALLLDPDPAVRFRLAERVAGDAALAAAVLDRVLSTDTKEARSGAFQLLASAAAPLRAELVSGAFDHLKQAPEQSQVLLAVTLLEWGPTAETEAKLLEAWKRSRAEELRRAALHGLLALGNDEAVAAARQRLREPLEEDLLALTAAAEAAAAHAEAAEGPGPWRDLAAALLETLEAMPADDKDSDLEAAHRVLEDLGAYLEALPTEAASEQECPALTGLAGPAKPWMAARRHRLACPEEERAPILLRASMPRPGTFALSLLGFLERLQVGSPNRNQMFHSVVDRLNKALSQWAGDPVTMTSTGVDLEAPWQMALWPESSQRKKRDKGEKQEKEASSWLATEQEWRAALSFSASDPGRLLDTLVRTSNGKLDLDGLREGILFTNALSVLPVGLFGLWDTEQERLAGEDTNTSTPAPPGKYFALGAASPQDEAEHRPLYHLELRDGVADWQQTHLFLRGNNALLTHSSTSEGLGPKEDEEEVAVEGTAYASRIDADLAQLTQALAPAALSKRLPSDLAADGVAFSVGTKLGRESLVTAVSIGGLSLRWASLGRNRPAAALRAPGELLPQDTFFWAAMSFDSEALRGVIREYAAELFEDAPPRKQRQVLDALQLLEGEGGMAIVGAPDPEDPEGGAAWKKHTFFYLAAEAEGLDRALGKLGGTSETHGGRRFFRFRDGLATHIGGFVVFGSNGDLLTRLGQEPFLASTPFYQQILAQAPEEAMLWAGMKSGILADAVHESMERGDGDTPGGFLVDVFSSFGDTVAWLRAGETSVAGQIASLPRLQSEESMARVRRLSGYAGFTQGSIATRWLPKRSLDDPAPVAVDLVLRLPEDLPGLELAWQGERLDQQAAGSGELRFVSRSAEPLPEGSSLELPISGPNLLPYLRNEHDLGLHVEELRNLAETIRGDETDPARIVRAIVAWAYESLDYSLVSGTVGVEEILATRQADCTEFSQLAIALARSLGIPARPVSGAVIGTHAAYFHRWAEVYLDRWYEIDPTWGVVRVPPTSLRIPAEDIGFLASLPGARITVEALQTEDGTWIRP